MSVRLHVIVITTLFDLIIHTISTSMIKSFLSNPVGNILNGTVIAFQAMFVGYLGFHLVGGAALAVINGDDTCVIYENAYSTSVDCSTDKWYLHWG